MAKYASAARLGDLADEDDWLDRLAAFHVREGLRDVC